MGPTASGKSELALRLATDLSAAILSIDSMQVYRGMDIGTAKPSTEEQARVPHFMVDVADPADTYTVATFQRVARDALWAHDGRLLVVGGSGLHMRAVFDPLDFPPHDPDVRADVAEMTDDARLAELLGADPTAAEFVDLKNPRRVERAVEVLRITGLTPSERFAHPDAQRVREYVPFLPFHAFGIDPGDHLETRVRARVSSMLEQGLVDEVASLELGKTAAQAVGYKQLRPVVAGEVSLAAASEDIVRATLALAKRQRTFFRRDLRIEWLPWVDSVEQRYVALRAAVDKVLS